jgi:hypothetical protein
MTPTWARDCPIAAGEGKPVSKRIAVGGAFLHDGSEHFAPRTLYLPAVFFWRRM